MDSIERTTGECQSPRISFSLNLSQNDKISPENRKEEGVANVQYDTDFEFCVLSNKDYRHSFSEEALLSVADELFVDGKILPVDRLVVSQPVSPASPLDLESSRCRSPVRSASYPPQRTSGCLGNVTSKSLPRHKPPSKWKEILLKLSNKENAERRRTSSKIVDQDRSHNAVKKRPSSPRYLLPFSRSYSAGAAEMKGNGLFCSSPFSRSQTMARNSERSSGSAAKAASLYSPRPGKPTVKSKSVEVGRVSPVLNVAACIGIHQVRGSWNGGGGPFGIFTKERRNNHLHVFFITSMPLPIA